MNRRENILHAWITVEQLSEGDIDTKESNVLTHVSEDWVKYFTDYMRTKKRLLRITDDDFKKSGIVLYFDIFSADEIISVLKEQYGLEETFEEISTSNKFSFALYFDSNLTLLSDKTFYTMSGFVHKHKTLPDYGTAFEKSFIQVLARKFDNGFASAISELFSEHKVTDNNFRYSFIRDMDGGDSNLHSFYISDLKKAKSISCINLDRYLGVFDGVRHDLDGDKDSPKFNKELLQNILQPKYYPLGRYPSNPDHALSFMQQVAVNLAINDVGTIHSVNGPPGTGKSTLLHDVFAELSVRQAKEICSLKNKLIAGKYPYFNESKIGPLPESISDFGIVVASSNNGAVQNIVNELPQKKKIDGGFLFELESTDYFMSISNTKYETQWKDKKPTVIPTQLEPNNWGLFSLEGGKANNISNLLLVIEEIVKNLDDQKPNPTVYCDFIKLYEEVAAYRESAQKFCDQVRMLPDLVCKHEKLHKVYETESLKRREELATFEGGKRKNIAELQEKAEDVKVALTRNDTALEENKDAKIEAERNFEVVKSQEPPLKGLLRLFHKSRVDNYFKLLNDANDRLNDISDKKNRLSVSRDLLTDNYNQLSSECNKAKSEIQIARDSYKKWETSMIKDLHNIDAEISRVRSVKAHSGFSELDFSLSYDDLQKSNPWFSKEYRVLQSRLFMKALSVRKQFLIENAKNIKAAINIWRYFKKNHIGKDNEKELILSAWRWINCAVPVISTTFASFGRMFEYLGTDSIGNLFIDEAGQALPQASVGAILRSKKIMAVGDPSQIKPVLTLDSKILNLIARRNNVSDRYVSANASTQTLVDYTSEYGFQKNEEEWIGIPLWVHRRSRYPMFTISNAISYDNLMVQGIPEETAYGKSLWYNEKGPAVNKYVKEQGEFLVRLINERLNKEPELSDNIFVISPFRNVSYQLAIALDEIGFTKRVGKNCTNVGTVHTFQGKEAKIVYLVLGTDTTCQGSARWAVSEPNIMNVAATRAKEEFYVIGDKSLYASLKSSVANKTISIIDEYNKCCNFGGL